MINYSNRGLVIGLLVKEEKNTVDLCKNERGKISNEIKKQIENKKNFQKERKRERKGKGKRDTEGISIKKERKIE